MRGTLGVFPGVLAGATLLAAAAAAPVAAQDTPRPPGLDLPVAEDTLENGMRVLALRRPGAPTAAFVLQFDVGSVNEAPGQTGIAHLLEHLLFKGTTTIGTRDLAAERALFRAMDAAQDTLLALGGGVDGPGAGAADGRGGEGVVTGEEAAARLRARIEALEDSARAFTVPNQLDRILTEHGARDMNATTGHEATTYFVRLPSNRAELWFVLEADRMANPVFREFYAERDVVAEERRTRVESSGGGRLMEAYYAAAYETHPYGRPVIGHMADITTHTREAAAAYHRRYYRPNNAVVAVVGDIDPDRVLAWARRYFGPIPAGAAPPGVDVEEPPQRAERRVRVPFDAAPELVVGWRVPDGYHADAAAITVAARVLGGGTTSRLYRRVVQDERLATSVSVFQGPGLRGPRLLTVTAQPLGGVSTEELEAAIYDEVAGLVREPPTAIELARVRNQVEAADVRRLASDLGLALQLAESVVDHGDWRETFRGGAALSAVTPADVVRVAREYLTAARRTVAVLVPTDGASR